MGPLIIDEGRMSHRRLHVGHYMTGIRAVSIPARVQFSVRDISSPLGRQIAVHIDTGVRPAKRVSRSSNAGVVKTVLP
jgi:hypothetical protein